MDRCRALAVVGILRHFLARDEPLLNRHRENILVSLGYTDMHGKSAVMG